ncbi:hypothetical protein TRIATDRAFT_304287 [Trichoderma atroviride IMI 206040]|uniref:Uncharacterized protein n=1 Tax=Hypocrea atroviridis (strain ATCC 20476 / IMI 206040) TaxID=452589 RepID=G9NHC9_HYPAI|nr:uncharacterized protein TRIATDRAFT_304287 [Trichoderma atroviride IMI 206040]EHK50023.1 hypothetical protein TRIATDRAFT_304287 [Trichoderma atroviride IMI 206040]
MTILATRLSLAAATAIGPFYDPSTRNGPAPLCRDPSLLCELCPSKNSPSRATTVQYPSEFANPICRPIGERSRRFEAQGHFKCVQLCLLVQVQCQSHAAIEKDCWQSHHTATATVSPASGQA